MKPNATTRSVVSTLQGERVGMSIDQSALSHIMSVLTDLYSDPEMAVIREYSTNAHDAHIEAGVTRPIEVTLPSPLSPYLVIRDFGSGLDIQDIREIYSRYGTSTKRDTNDLVGTLGLGCKSALTYTDQFTLAGVKNGRCIQVSVSRDETGAGSMTIVADYETDESSGVTVTIPAKQYHQFEEKAHDFFQFWGEGTVLVNGQEPERIQGIELDNEILAVHRDKLDQSVIVMGNVPYPFDTSEYNFRVVARVAMGAVQFTPSREALQMTTPTKNTIEDIKNRVQTGQQAAIEKIIADAPTKMAALEAAFEADAMFRYKGKLMYGRDEIPIEFDSSKLPHPDGERPKSMLLVKTKNNWSSRYRSYSNQEAGYRFPISLVRNTVFLTGCDQKGNLTPYFRQKLNTWWDNNCASFADMVVERFLLVDELPHADWVDPKRIRPWEEVKQTKVTQPKRTDGRPTGAYEAYVEGVYTGALQADEIDTSKPLFYWVGKYCSNKGLIQEKYPNATLVGMSSNREAKFKRSFPQAKRVEEAAREIAQAWADGLTEEERLSLHLFDTHRYDRSDLQTLDETQIDDPDLAALILASKQDYPQTLLSTRRLYEGLYTLSEFEYNSPVEKYPLLEAYIGHYWNGNSSSARQHLYTYLNAIFMAEMETV